MHEEMETTFHDVNIHGATFYPGTSVRQPIVMSTRLELAARSSLLAELLAELQLCDGPRHHHHRRGGGQHRGGRPRLLQHGSVHHTR